MRTSRDKKSRICNINRKNSTAKGNDTRTETNKTEVNKTVTITIISVNDCPTTLDTSGSAEEGETALIFASTIDIDSVVDHTIIVTSQPVDEFGNQLGTVVVVETDGGGVRDGCDVCAGGDDLVGTDGDGVPDVLDNCPRVPNGPSTGSLPLHPEGYLQAWLTAGEFTGTQTTEQCRPSEDELLGDRSEEHTSELQSQA